MKGKISRGELVIYGLPFIFFIGLAAFAPVGIYNDTAQYVSMHIHRDPLYPLFLWVLRGLTGNAEWYLRLAVWLQDILAWISVVMLTAAVKREYGLKIWQTACVCVLAMAPHILTPAAANSGLILSNSIMSESVTYPLFYLFTAYMLRMLGEHRQSDKWIALVYALLLSLARGQMMVMIIVWLIGAVYLTVVSHSKVLVRTAVFVLVFAAVFFGRSQLVKLYNLAFNGYYCGTTMSTVSVLSNIVYASDADSIGLVTDEEAETFYSETYALADYLGYNYADSAPGFMNRAMDLEDKHDRIKFECMDELWRSMHDADYPELKDDYELETIEQDRIAGQIIRNIWPACFGTWLYDYLGLAAVGFIRTVAVVNPILNVYALVVYALLIVGILLLLSDKKDRADNIPLIRLGLFTLLAVCANVFGTAAVIMCLSRYMVYTLPLVYISVILTWCRILRHR